MALRPLKYSLYLNKDSRWCCGSLRAFNVWEQCVKSFPYEQKEQAQQFLKELQQERKLNPKY